MAGLGRVVSFDPVPGSTFWDSGVLSSEHETGREEDGVAVCVCGMREK